MSNYYEIDFCNLKTTKSCDAIPIRYQINSNTYIHLVDGGFQSSGEELVEYINKHYSSPKTINNIV